MVTTLFALLVVGGVCLYVMTSEERMRAARTVLLTARQVYDAIRLRRSALEPFHAALRARTAWPFVSIALVALNAAIFLGMLFGAGAVGDPDTLVRWGASVGPLTTHGEWLRLVSALFVQPGFFGFVISVFVIVQIGFVVERIVGHFAFALAYLGAGVLAGLVTLAEHPLAVHAGAVGPILGIYGLLIVVAAAAAIQRWTVAVPLSAAKSFAPGAVVLFVYAIAVGIDLSAVMVALAAGGACGLIATVRVGDDKPPTWRIAAAAVAVAVAAVIVAYPLHPVIDVRPEVERVVASEDRTAESYRTAVDRFRRGRVPIEALTRLIDRTIVPELETTDRRLRALTGVAPEHEALLADAERYVQLRSQSWRLRSQGLRTTDMAMLGKAEGTQRAALDALDRVRHAF